MYLRNVYCLPRRTREQTTPSSCGLPPSSPTPWAWCAGSCWHLLSAPLTERPEADDNTCAARHNNIITQPPLNTYYSLHASLSFHSIIVLLFFSSGSNSIHSRPRRLRCILATRVYIFPSSNIALGNIFIKKWQTGDMRICQESGESCIAGHDEISFRLVSQEFNFKREKGYQDFLSILSPPQRSLAQRSTSTFDVRT